jgi:hypothetical protein
MIQIGVVSTGCPAQAAKKRVARLVTAVVAAEEVVTESELGVCGSMSALII